MEYRELIDAFAAKYGVTAPPGEEGVETIDVGGTIVTFREDPGARAVILSAEVGEMPPDAKGRFASILLKAGGLLAANGEGAFCVDEDDVFHAVRSVPLALADLDAFASALESLVNLAELWREHADVFAHVDDEMAKQAAEEGALNPLFGGPDLIGN